MAAAATGILSSRPTRVRYGVLGFACTLSMITYLDRVCFATAASGFVTDLGLNSVADLKWAFSAFGLAYALFEVPSGWLGDVFGPRRVLIRIVLWWSAFTALTGLIGMQVGGRTLGLLSWSGYVVTPLALLVVVRFLFGMGEAGAYPNITRALHNWFPLAERGVAQGAVWMSGRLMGGLTPMVWMVLIEGIRRQAESPGAASVAYWIPPLMHWRTTFWFFGLIGVLWCVAFALWFRNRPEEKPEVNAAELGLIRAGGAESRAAHAGVPWGRILRSRNLWFLFLMYACQSYGWYFYITYLPRFLEEQYGVLPSSVMGAIYKGGPLWLGAAGCLIGGFFSDWFIRRTGNRRWGRSLIGVIGHVCTTVCFLLCPLAPTAFWFFAAVSLAGFFTDLTMGSAWASCQDIGRRYAAIVAGFMNMMGNFGGTLACWVSGYVLQLALNAHAAGLGVGPEELSGTQKAAALLSGYHFNFYIFAAAYVVGVICWLNIDASRPIETGETE